MHPEFSKVVDPVFAYVINLLDRIEARAEPNLNAEVERDRIKQTLNEAENRLQGSEKDSSMWELSRYALIVWIDETLIHADWEGRSSWEAEPLEFELLGTNIGGEQYFKKAEEARRATSFDALEVFYLGVILGFKGFYATPNSRSQAESKGFPPTLTDWTSEIGRVITAGQLREFSGSKRDLQRCNPLRNAAWFLAVCILSVILVLATVIVWYYKGKA